ncbi:putrescine aminotransferase/taurine--2-oxoglutarate transaminase [Nitrosospira sp. Nsp2]|nr:putrescine aminotransferase/taurine--2-oxoglutarate transaminase [Nitrosospira sp. Nsp2]
MVEWPRWVRLRNDNHAGRFSVRDSRRNDYIEKARRLNIGRKNDKTEHVMASREQRFLGRKIPGALQVTKAEGSFIFDDRGRKYIDFVMGWCVGNFGWGNEVLTNAAAEFDGPDYVFPGHSYGPWTELAELLASISPGKLMKSFRATGGSEAVDIALQAAMVHTGRQKFLSLEGSYHGNAIGGLSVADSKNRQQCRNLLPHCYKVELPLDNEALERIDKFLKTEEFAAFIMEPISVNLGVLIPEMEFMTELAKLCRRYGTLLIMDEVATGFGRTGTLFASERYHLEPDIMCIAKAVTGGLGGLGATITTAAVARSMEENGSYYSTYGWHPRSVHVAIATIHYITTHQKQLLGIVNEMSEYFRSRLSQLRFKGVANHSIAGMAIGLELDTDDYASDIQAKCQRNGLLITAEGSTLLLLPSLNIDQAIAKQGLDILERCI